MGIAVIIFLIYITTIVTILCVPWIERHAVYIHYLKLTGGKNLNHPEKFGCAHRQTTPFLVETKDGERLHAWHVIPIGLYYKNATRLCRSLSSTMPDKFHALVFDYRGFGLSSGMPSEEGLFTDAQSVFQWDTNVAGIPPERIVIFDLKKVSITGLIITGSFPDVPTMLSEYRAFFSIRAYGLVDLDRLTDIVRRSPTYHIAIFHARDNPIVPWSLSDMFFEHAVNTASNSSFEKEGFEQGKVKKWPTSKGLIRQEVLRYGEHDKIMMYSQVAMAVRRAFESTTSTFTKAD
ncbi:hypothetical protein T440DRAFT_485748 [Plenodomus tracheiphilus IPT5]|uniref:Alpha/beta-hydrolase n=1 Tax=Plenodomus tracheiphilus IPT5 TaxID=1408161 RepID=A0A6A7BLF9_9PLEO|nr:hypothetical protein T440DRAFT_485748 [Plenodomus tracheiphilus IPT5]